MPCPPARMGLLALVSATLLSGCFSLRGSLELATLEGVEVGGEVIQSDVETRNCSARLLGLIPLSGLGANPEAILRRTLTRFPDGNGIHNASLTAATATTRC